MQAYLRISFQHQDQHILEEIMARLLLLQFEAFEEKDDRLDAYISEEFCDWEMLDKLSSDYMSGYTFEKIPPTNWNQAWESNYPPVVVDDFCAVVAPFHSNDQPVEHLLHITPKMSFGTGHHATTSSMIRLMRSLDLKNKKVLDIGTGTGILAILAEKMGAVEVVATEMESWSVEAARENALENKCNKIRVEETTGLPSEKFDLVLANITSSVILSMLVDIADLMKPGTLLLTSGYYQKDQEQIRHSANQHGLEWVTGEQQDEWCADKWVKPD